MKIILTKTEAHFLMYPASIVLIMIGIPVFFAWVVVELWKKYVWKHYDSLVRTAHPEEFQSP